EVLPFDHIDCEVTKPYLWKERVASLKEGATHDCAYGDERCTACGSCDYEVVDTIVYHPEDYTPQHLPAPPPLPEGHTMLRLRYAKEGSAVALSHLETMTALLRTFRRAKLSIPHTQGFHPKPRVSFGPACPVGTESEAEYLDLELHGTPAAGQVAERIRRELPEGFRLLSCEPAETAAESLSRTIRAIEYRVELPDGAPCLGGRLRFFALTYAVTWTLFISVAAAAIPVRSPLGGLLVLLGAFSPSLVALWLTARAEGSTGVRALLGRVLQWRVAV